jgi:hypothetical protein
MLTQHRYPVCLSLMSYDLPLWSVVEGEATLYQKDAERFHLLMTEPLVQGFDVLEENASGDRASEAELENTLAPTPRLLWLELSPYRVIITMQGNGKFSYRHFWEQGVYGISRYWLQNDTALQQSIRLRNFVRSLTLSGQPIPKHFRVEYELWTNQLQIGRYVLNLEIQ